MTASIAQEFYKLRDEWQTIDSLQNWKLAVWVAEYPDVDIIDKFLEVERSPVGVFKDVFFRFDSEYQGDAASFETLIWEEFLSWFDDCPHPELDLYTTLLSSGLLIRPFKPDRTLPPGLKSLWQELLRFRACIKDIDKQTHFCLYFPVVLYHTHNIAKWLAGVLDQVPQEIRLVTIDFAQDRRVNLRPSAPCVYLHPKLNMLDAVKNEMKKDCGNYNTVDAESRFTRQIIEVMESTTKDKGKTTPKEIHKLFSIAQELQSPAAQTGSWMVAAQAYYAIRDIANSHLYTDKAIAVSAAAMEQQDAGGYPIWKSCMMLKAALLYGERKRKAALEVYEQLAETAGRYGDAYTVMEGRRLAGHLYYERRAFNTAFEYMLLALSAGAYLEPEVRRQSTFLHAAYMAVFLAKQVRNPQEEQELQAQLAEWLGEDWEALLQQEGIDHAKTKRKATIF